MAEQGLMTVDPINESIGLELDMINILFVILFLSGNSILNGYHTASDLFKSSSCKVTEKNNWTTTILSPNSSIYYFIILSA